jgi:uncharacterized membrane protein
MNGLFEKGGRRLRITILVASLAAAVCPATALAELRFCNRTDKRVDLVIAYAQKDAPGTTTNQDGGATAEGWFWVEPGECGKVSDIRVGDYWAYFYATGGTRVWNGSSMLCIPGKPFTRGVRFMRQGETCPVGASLKGFRRMDANTPRFTMTLNP